MRFDRGKAWPHPVLRPPGHGDDYPEAAFEVDISCIRSTSGLAVNVEATFSLSDPYLLNLVERNDAEYVLLVRSPSTYFRRELNSATPEILMGFSGELAGRVTLSPFLVATRTINPFRADGWHEDFRGQSYALPAGAVLAVDIPKEYWIDTVDQAPYGAAMQVVEEPRQQDGRWQLQLSSSRIQIQLSSPDYQRFELARSKSNGTLEGHYLMNGLYLPAIIATLHEADQNPDDYAEYRWYTVLNDRLQDLGCSPIGGENVKSRAVDAQKVFDSPFTKMPII